MKKLLFLLIALSIYGCSSDDGVQKPVALKLQIPEIPEEVRETYNFTDLHVDVYLNKDDYLSETNKVYSGKFDAEGKVIISEKINRGVVYIVDIYSDDNYLSNWQYVDFDTVTTDGQILIQAIDEDATYFEEIYLTKESRMLIGTWNFTQYGHHNHEEHDRTERTKLVIGKDFSMTSFERYNGTDYTIEYALRNNTIKYISTSPSENGYPYYGAGGESGGLRNPDGMLLRFYGGTDNIIEFWDYADEEARYSK